ncbi:MAG: glycerol-3-phosphate cytidylyltransferase [Candidatus ainarchaeum sp.]|nr:glycerol-3-phosphate cytidylyltransferase [Candidatus ainarchaeum sp.]
MKIGITYGTFDILHYGHVRLLKRAKSKVDFLIVALSTDEFNKLKNKTSFYNYKIRKELLSSIKYVDKVIPENTWNQKIKDVKKYNVDVFFMGVDWKDKFNFLKPYCEIVYLSRTKGISSTYIKSKINQ